MTVPELRSERHMQFPQLRPKASILPSSPDPFPCERWGLGMSLEYSGASSLQAPQSHTVSHGKTGEHGIQFHVIYVYMGT